MSVDKLENHGLGIEDHSGGSVTVGTILTWRIISINTSVLGLNYMSPHRPNSYVKPYPSVTTLGEKACEETEKISQT